MGKFHSKEVEDKTRKKIVAFGVLGAGRSSLVYRLSQGEMPPKDLYYGSVDVGEVKYDDLTLYLWDYNGRSHEFFWYKMECIGASGIIFVIDSSDPERFDLAFDRVNWVFQNEELKNVTVMVVANKQDLDDAVGPEVIEEELKKACKIRSDFTVFVMPMSVTSEDDHSVQLAYRLLVKTLKRQDVGRAKKGLIPHAWETAEKDAEDSGVEEMEEEERRKKKLLKKEKKNILKDPVHVIKSILTR